MSAKTAMSLANDCISPYKRLSPVEINALRWAYDIYKILEDLSPTELEMNVLPPLRRFQVSSQRSSLIAEVCLKALQEQEQELTYMHQTVAGYQDLNWAHRNRPLIPCVEKDVPSEDKNNVKTTD